MSREVYFILALLATGGLTYLIRALPLVFVRRRIESRFLRSFLYYVPYVVLATLTFPAILYCTDSVISGIVASAVCAFLAYLGKGLITCTFGSIISVLIVQWILGMLG